MLKLNFIWLIGLTILHSFKCLQDFEIEAIPEDYEGRDDIHAVKADEHSIFIGVDDFYTLKLNVFTNTFDSNDYFNYNGYGSQSPFIEGNSIIGCEEFEITKTNIETAEYTNFQPDPNPGDGPSNCLPQNIHKISSEYFAYSNFQDCVFVNHLTHNSVTVSTSNVQRLFLSDKEEKYFYSMEINADSGLIISTRYDLIDDPTDTEHSATLTLNPGGDSFSDWVIIQREEDFISCYNVDKKVYCYSGFIGADDITLSSGPTLIFESNEAFFDNKEAVGRRLQEDFPEEFPEDLDATVRLNLLYYNKEKNEAVVFTSQKAMQLAFINFNLEIKGGTVYTLNKFGYLKATATSFENSMMVFTLYYSTDEAYFTYFLFNLPECYEGDIYIEHKVQSFKTVFPYSGDSIYFTSVPSTIKDNSILIRGNSQIELNTKYNLNDITYIIKKQETISFKYTFKQSYYNAFTPQIMSNECEQTIHICYLSCGSCSSVGNSKAHQCSTCANKRGYFTKEGEKESNCYLSLPCSFLNSKLNSEDITGEELINDKGKLSQYIKEGISNSKAGESSGENTVCYNVMITVTSLKQGQFIVYSSEAFYSKDIEKYKDYLKLDLGKCASKIKEAYSLNEDSKVYIALLVFQIEQDSMTDKIQYSVYDEYGNELDLSICQETPIKMYKKVNQENKLLDYEFAKKFYEEEGVCLYDINDPFFTDICFPYSNEEDKDLTLGNRRRDLFINATLCDEGCELYSMNVTSGDIECKCEPVSFGLSNVVEENEYVSDIKEIIGASNFKLFKCFKLLKYKDNYPPNAGSWILIVIIIASIALFICFYIIDGKKILTILNEEMIPEEKEKENNPEEQENEVKVVPNENQDNKSNKDCSEIASKNEMLSINNNNNPITATKFQSTDTLNKVVIQTTKAEFQTTKNEDTNKEEEEMIDDEYNEMDFDEAIEEDNRGYFKMLWSIICQKQFILSTFINKSIFNPWTLRIAMLIFAISAFLFFSALFYSDDYISDRYFTKDNLDLAYILKNELAKSVYVSLVALVVERLITLSKDAFLRYKKIKEDEKKENYNEKIEEFKTKTIRLWIIITIVEFVLCIIFWYFLFVFCTVYKNNQSSLIISTVISIVFNILLTVVICIFVCTGRFLGIKHKMKILFMISTYLSEIF